MVLIRPTYLRNEHMRDIVPRFVNHSCQRVTTTAPKVESVQVHHRALISTNHTTLVKHASSGTWEVDR